MLEPGACTTSVRIRDIFIPNGRWFTGPGQPAALERGRRASEQPIRTEDAHADMTTPQREVLPAHPAMFAALAVPNFGRYVSGQALSLIGTWVETVAQALLVLQLTHSGTILVLTTAARYAPILLLSPYAGLVVDRYPKRRVLLATQLGLGPVGPHRSGPADQGRGRLRDRRRPGRGGSHPAGRDRRVRAGRRGQRHLPDHGQLDHPARLDPEYRGRVTALWSMALVGSTPIGSPVIGALSDAAGPRYALGLGAAACRLPGPQGHADRRGRHHGPLSHRSPRPRSRHRRSPRLRNPRRRSPRRGQRRRGVRMPGRAGTR